MTSFTILRGKSNFYIFLTPFIKNYTTVQQTYPLIVFNSLLNKLCKLIIFLLNKDLLVEYDAEDTTTRVYL